MIEVMKKFLSSAKLERIALEINERLPLSFKYRYIYGPSFLYWQAFLRESDKWDKDKIATYQLEQLKNLLSHSMRNVPYYKKLFDDCGFNPEKMQSLEDIKAVSYLNKETVRDRADDFVDKSISPKSLLKKSTSGSTGTPLTVYKTQESQKIFTAFWNDLLLRVGYSQKSKTVMFWSTIDLGKRKNLPFLKYGKRLVLSSRYLTDEWMAKYSNIVRRFEPGFIIGYPNTLAIFSAFIKKNNYAPFKNLKTVITQSETLYDWQRQLIEEVFGVRVFSIYVMTELALFAGECEYSNSLHMYPQYGFTEFSPLASNYEEIMATGFTNYAMPLIRYKTADVGLRGKSFCPHCGRYYQLVDSLEGRINDFLVDREGKIIPRLMPWIEIFPNTKQYRFFQEEPGKAYLKIIRAETFSESDTVYIRSKLEEMLGPMKDSIDIEIVFVDDIPTASSGKIKLVDQKLDIRKFLWV